MIRQREGDTFAQLAFWERVIYIEEEGAIAFVGEGIGEQLAECLHQVRLAMDEQGTVSVAVGDGTNADGTAGPWPKRRIARLAPLEGLRDLADTVRFGSDVENELAKFNELLAELGSVGVKDGDDFRVGGRLHRCLYIPLRWPISCTRTTFSL